MGRIRGSCWCKPGNEWGIAAVTDGMAHITRLRASAVRRRALRSRLFESVLRSAPYVGSLGWWTHHRSLPCGSKINLPAINLVAQKLPEKEISGAPTEVAGKGSDARTALAKNGMRGAGQLPYLGKFCSKFGTKLPETGIHLQVICLHDDLCPLGASTDPNQAICV